ncbi:MAG: flagellar biosynthesis protein FlhF [Nitrospiraceae bacterium]|nr:MAG: flagellar biosynthesis protein FlhF [Nitrospiraceae bacterium]
MKIKKFRARNFSEALSVVKREMGADAVILSSTDKKGAASYVEVTAAVDYDMDMSAGDALSGPRQFNGAVSAGGEERGGAAYPVPQEITDLKQEIMNIRGSLETMKNCGFRLDLPRERRHMFQFLRERSIKDEFALKLIARAGEIEQIEQVMCEDLSLVRTDGRSFAVQPEQHGRKGRRIAMLIGPTGSGKTTTVAKLASMAIREGKKAAMISIDTYKIGAAEQIRIYSRMIGIPLDIVSSVENFKKSIARFSDRDLILVDTAGQNPRDERYIGDLKGIYNSGIPVETHLLLSMSSDCDFLIDVHRHYQAFPVDFVGFTKTDEAVRLGKMYTLCCLYQKPVAYITTGQQVPGNIEYVDGKKLTELILKTGSA